MHKIFTVLNKNEEKFLHQPTKEVVDVSDSKIQDLIQEMYKIMKQSDGVGLSANQIGESYQIIVVEYENKKLVLINPKITKASKKITIEEEGCLSVPKIIALVPRSQKINIEALNQDGRKIKIKAKNMLARILQHEIDHLNGILMIDKAVKIYKITQTKNGF